MIKKLLYLVIIVVGIYGVYTCYTTGFEKTISFLNIDIPSFAEVTGNKSKLDSDMSKLNSLNTTGIASATENVVTQEANYKSKRDEYVTLAASASEEEIAEANKVEKYLLDYLWIKVGNYASDNGVKFKMTPDIATASLTFDITGTYISVINFIYDLENDTELNFGINGIVVEGGSSSSVVKAYFKVEDVNVVTSPQE